MPEQLANNEGNQLPQAQALLKLLKRMGDANLLPSPKKQNPRKSKKVSQDRSTQTNGVEILIDGSDITIIKTNVASQRLHRKKNHTQEAYGYQDYGYAPYGYDDTNPYGTYEYDAYGYFSYKDTYNEDLFGYALSDNDIAYPYKSYGYGTYAPNVYTPYDDAYREIDYAYDAYNYDIYGYDAYGYNTHPIPQKASNKPNQTVTIKVKNVATIQIQPNGKVHLSTGAEAQKNARHARNQF